MPRYITNLIIPIAFLVAIIFAVSRKSPPASATGEEIKKPTTAEFDPSQFLVRPFSLNEQQTALALDGGAFPAANGQVPTMVIGKNVLRTVHLAWIHDWSHPQCREIFHQLKSLYDSDEGQSLPALKLYLNPVFSDQTGESLHRAMLQFYFRSRERANIVSLAASICNGTIKPDAEAIRQRVEEIDASIIGDWHSSLDWLEADLTHTFTVANTQQARNKSIHGEKIPAQLTSMLAILSPQADRQKIIEFIKDADAAQRAWLQSQRK